MSRLSLVITTLVYYFPIFGLWRIILEERIRFTIPLFGFNFPVNIPNSGIILLVFYSLLTWLGIAVILWAVERILKIDLLEKLKLRNGMLFAEMPKVTIKVLDIAAYILFGFLLIKYIFLSLFQILASTGLMAWLGKLIPMAGQNIGLTFAQVINSFLSKPQEMACLALSLLIIVVSIVSRVERKERFYSDIQKTQEIRHQLRDQKIIIPRVKIN